MGALGLRCTEIQSAALDRQGSAVSTWINAPADDPTSNTRKHTRQAVLTTPLTNRLYRIALPETITTMDIDPTPFTIQLTPYFKNHYTQHAKPSPQVSITATSMDEFFDHIMQKFGHQLGPLPTADNSDPPNYTAMEITPADAPKLFVLERLPNGNPNFEEFIQQIGHLFRFRWIAQGLLPLQFMRKL
ncbi:hypothetical protein DFJ73DRAFT_800177 [Zopfochytrium polystomum]|nr:hypothetical protein DFJ73DRAFT_800177 [Zopfochytrium polystomum]